ncbi:MAG: T9SS type A sorting domain-containing protein, partial [Chitinophagaceae bacterium]
NNTSIGLAASGRGNLPSFTASNPNPPGGAANTGTVTVTPSANKCAGTPYVINLSVLDCIAQSGNGSGNDMARSASQFVVGPNPATSRVTVELKGADAGPYTAQILTTTGLPLGRPVVFNGTTHSMDLSGLTPGTYVLQLVNQRTKQTVQKQVIKL